MFIYLIISFLIAISCGEDTLPVPEEQPPVEASICANLYPPADTIISTHTKFTKSNYPARIKVFQADTVDEGDIVILGNSLTEQGGNWNLKLGTTNAKNRGISGDNTDGALARLSELLCRKPSIVFIMIGTNDLFTSYNAEKVAQNIDSIGFLLGSKLPESEIIVQTIMPLGSGNNKELKLLAINDLLKSKENTPYQLLDTFEYMANENGNLPAELTYDGIHLNSDGYAKWIELLKTKL